MPRKIVKSNRKKNQTNRTEYYEIVARPQVRCLEAPVMAWVCIDCRYVGSRASGIGEVVRALVDLLPEMAPDLSFLLLRNPNHDGPLSRAANVEERIVRSAANGPVSLMLLQRIASLSKVDLFHAPANILPFGLRMPTVTTVHDIMWLTNPDLTGAGHFRRIDRLFYAYGIEHALKRSTMLASISAATRDQILEFYPAVADRLRVTRSGVSERFQPRQDPAALSSLGLDPDRRFVLTVGQGAPYKNHEGAVRSFARAFADRPDIDLVFVQRQGRNARQLHALARDLGVIDRVRIRSAVSFRELTALYGGAMVLLHPSFIEGFGNPPAEAMACGCPVITSGCSAMPEVAADAALYADPHDADSFARQLVRIETSPQFVGELRARGLARAAQLRWSDFAKANLDIYRDVLAAT